MNCEKCGQGQMVPGKVYRLSGCLVAIGYTLWIPAVIVLILASIFAIIGTGATGSTMTESAKQYKREAIQELKNIEGLPQVVINDFKNDASIEDSNLKKLEASKRNKVNNIVSNYQASMTGAGAGAGIAAIIGGTTVIVLYVIFVPTLIVGFLLTLRRKVMKCPECGYFFERA